MSNLPELTQALADYQAAQDKQTHLSESLAEARRQLADALALVGQTEDVATEIAIQTRAEATQIVVQRLEAQASKQAALLRLAEERIEKVQAHQRFYEGEILDCELALLCWLPGYNTRLESAIAELRQIEAGLRTNRAIVAANGIRDALQLLHATMNQHNTLANRLSNAREGLQRVAPPAV